MKLMNIKIPIKIHTAKMTKKTKLKWTKMSKPGHEG